MINGGKMRPLRKAQEPYHTAGPLSHNLGNLTSLKPLSTSGL